MLKRWITIFKTPKTEKSEWKNVRKKEILTKTDEANCGFMVQSRCMSSWPRVTGGNEPKNGGGPKLGGRLPGVAHRGTWMPRPSTPKPGWGIELPRGLLKPVEKWSWWFWFWKEENEFADNSDLLSASIENRWTFYARTLKVFAF